MTRVIRLTDVERLDRDMSEDQLLTNVMDTARLFRWMAVHYRRSDRAITQGDAGFPDVTLARSGRILFVELKTQLGQLSPEQQRWADVLRECPGVEVYVLRPSDFRIGKIEKVLR